MVVLRPKADYDEANYFFKCVYPEYDLAYSPYVVRPLVEPRAYILSIGNIKKVEHPFDGTYIFNDGELISILW